jgi:hypothetical protein
MTNALAYLSVGKRKVFKLSQQIFEEHTEDSLAIDVLDVPTRQEFLDFSIHVVIKHTRIKPQISPTN